MPMSDRNSIGKSRNQPGMHWAPLKIRGTYGWKWGGIRSAIGASIRSIHAAWVSHAGARILVTRALVRRLHEGCGEFDRDVVDRERCGWLGARTATAAAAMPEPPQAGQQRALTVAGQILLFGPAGTQKNWFGEVEEGRRMLTKSRERRVEASGAIVAVIGRE